jgi:hypothetical protein
VKCLEIPPNLEQRGLLKLPVYAPPRMLWSLGWGGIMSHRVVRPNIVQEIGGEMRRLGASVICALILVGMNLISSLAMAGESEHETQQSVLVNG